MGFTQKLTLHVRYNNVEFGGGIWPSNIDLCIEIIISEVWVLGDYDSNLCS